MKKHKKHTIKKKKRRAKRIKKHRKRGPYKFNKARKTKWLKQYDKLRSITAACQAVGIGRRLIYTTIKADKIFAERKEQIDDLLVDALESKLFKILLENKNPNPALFIFTLCNMRPDKWRQKVEHIGDPQHPMEFIIKDANKCKHRSSH